MAACSWCQPNIYSYDWVNETVWQEGCTDYNSVSFDDSIAVKADALNLPSYVFVPDLGASWDAAEASVAAVPDATSEAPSATATSDGGFGDEPQSGDDGDNGDEFDDDSADLGLILGVALGCGLGIPLLCYTIVLIVFCVRQNRRKAFYGPLAEYYRNGGQFPPQPPGSAPQMTAASPAPSNPFTTPVTGTQPNSANADFASFMNYPSQPYPGQPSPGPYALTPSPQPYPYLTPSPGIPPISPPPLTASPAPTFSEATMQPGFNPFYAQPPAAGGGPAGDFKLSPGVPIV